MSRPYFITKRPFSQEATSTHKLTHESRFKKGALKGPIKMRTSGSTSRSTPTH